MSDDGWGTPAPIWTGDALTDLHDGKGTSWQRTEAGQLYPDCDCHRPKVINEARRREAAERALAEHRGLVYRPPETARDAPLDPPQLPVAIQPVQEPPEASGAPVRKPVDDAHGLRLFAKRLRQMAWENKWDEEHKR
jgi:hypothetical protein